uniref:Uncharacterized protein n=1 Tax=Rousettus aegyptiacus TaxID=9407 RepID=A0A7J8F047_ROUAE|nr:hypothetical protein HJG63_012229 [Rousettus aegyptiacus]
MPPLLVEGIVWPGMGPPGRGPLWPPRPACSSRKLRANREVPVQTQDSAMERRHSRGPSVTPDVICPLPVSIASPAQEEVRLGEQFQHRETLQRSQKAERHTRTGLGEEHRPGRGPFAPSAQSTHCPTSLGRQQTTQQDAIKKIVCEKTELGYGQATLNKPSLI